MSHVYVYGRYMRSLVALVVIFMVRSESKIKRAEFEDDSALSLAAKGSKLLHFTFFLENLHRYHSHSHASETMLKYGIEMTECKPTSTVTSQNHVIVHLINFKFYISFAS